MRTPDRTLQTRPTHSVIDANRPKPRIPVGRFSIPESAFSSAVFVLIAYYYYFLNANLLQHGLFRPLDHGLTFNSMLAHLLHGRFDVDPAIIGDEAFARGGRTYAYFGILPSLFRLPLLLFGQLNSLDITVASCIIGASIAVYLKVRAAIAVILQSGEVPIRVYLCLAILAVFFIGGPEVQMSKPSIYQEVIFWDDAFAAGFIYCAVIGLVVRREFSVRLIGSMATLAGLALLTRVSTAIGMYAATGLLAASNSWISMKSCNSTIPALRSSLQRFKSAVYVLMSSHAIVAMTILLLFAALAGLVNFERWGSALVFAPLKVNVSYTTNFPERVRIVNSYGEFNIERVWYGVLYYFLPIWSWIRTDGNFSFSEFQHRTISAVEMPPSSFLVSDPLLIALSCCFFSFVRSAREKADFDARLSALLIFGLSIPALLMLGWEYMSFRYRMEFNPLLSLTAILGLYLLCSPAAGKANRSHGLGSAFLGLAAVGILVSHVLYAVYVLSVFGPSDVVSKAGWVGFYQSRIEQLLGRLLQDRVER